MSFKINIYKTQLLGTQCQLFLLLSIFSSLLLHISHLTSFCELLVHMCSQISVGCPIIYLFPSILLYYRYQSIVFLNGANITFKSFTKLLTLSMK